MEGAWQAQVGTENAYQYNGKELNEDFDLNWYDYGARWYDAAVGRWWSVDPLGEDEHTQSPYNYVANNSVLFVDPTGMSKEAFSFNNLNILISRYNEGIKNQDKEFLSWLDNTTQKPQFSDKATRSSENRDDLLFKDRGLSSFSEGGPGDYLLSSILSISEKFGDAIFGINRKIRQDAINNFAGQMPGMYSAQLVSFWMQGGDVSTENWLYGGWDYLSVFGGPAISTIRFNFSPFSLRGGYGVFGKKGLSVNGYKIEAMYATPRVGEGTGTILSIKQLKQGGALWRWDYGINHATGEMGFHSTIRFHWNGVKYGNSAQRTWYPSTFKPPFFKPLK